MNKPELTITDESAVSWVVNWPTKTSVIDYLQNFSPYILQKLATGNINLVFDKYYDYSIKLSARSGCGRSTCRTQRYNRHLLFRLKLQHLEGVKISDSYLN